MKKIHLICHFCTMLGGAELECLELAKQLRERGNNVSIWAKRESPVSNSTLKQHGVSRIRPFHSPITGTLIISGGCIRPPRLWSRLAHFRRTGRVIVICNDKTVQPERVIRHYKRRTRHQPEMVFISTTQPTYSGKHAGAVHPSPISIEKFKPKAFPINGDLHPIVIGRLSRDVVRKHHPEDPRLYRDLVAQGMHIKLMGANQLRKYDSEISKCSGTFFLEVGQETASEFLTSLDIFFYRTSLDQPETFGRIVPEAMLTGLPVVCGDNGGYTSLIKHGINGFLCSNTAEAYAILAELAVDAELRQRIGLQARRDILKLYSPEAMADRLGFYER